MIRRLRARHRVWTLLLALVLPAGVAAALALRPKSPLALEIPFALTDQATVGPIVQRRDLFGATPIDVRLWTEPATSRRVIELTPARDFERPDLLVYWAPAAPPADALPPGSILLGSLAGTQARRMRLPENARNARGWICIYCLAEPEIVASGMLEAGS